jgi:DNA-nicking Smr family endonuclease
MKAGEDEGPPAVEIPIDGTLDLHTFDPREIEELVADYLAACRERGILDVRIVHGKGRGVLRRRVESALRRTPGVEDVRTGGSGGGEWGATLVRLSPACED